MKMVNVDASTIESIAGLDNVTVAKWHPRQGGKFLFGTTKGTLKLYNVEKKIIEMEYISLSVGVVDLYWNPGEDVFLALFQDGRLRLYG